MVSDLTLQAQYISDMVNSNYITPTEWCYYANGSMAELDDILVSKNEDYRLTMLPTSIVTMSGVSSNQALIPLPIDFYKLRLVEFYNSANSMQFPWVPLKQFSLPERDMFSYAGYRSTTGTLGLLYKLSDGYVEIVPAPYALGQYQVWYTPVCYQFTGSGDTRPLPQYMTNQAWTDYIVVDMAIKAQLKQQLDASQLKDTKERLRGRLLAMAAVRDAGAPKRGRNTRATNDAFWWGYPIGGGYGY